MADGHGWAPGGYLTLATLVEAYEPAFVYDWRTRFGLSLTALVTGELSLAEAWLLTCELLHDPGSRVYAAIAGWPHAWSREAFLLADLIDLIAAVHTDPKRRSRLAPYPRPTDASSKPERPTWGQTTQPQTQVRAVLAQRGHTLPPEH